MNYGNKPLDHPPIPPQKPCKCSIHMEWESSEHAHMGLGRALINYELRRIHNKGVMAHLDRDSYYMLFQPMMEEGYWREPLEK